MCCCRTELIRLLCDELFQCQLISSTFSQSVCEMRNKQRLTCLTLTGSSEIRDLLQQGNQITPLLSSLSQVGHLVFWMILKSKVRARRCGPSGHAVVAQSLRKGRRPLTAGLWTSNQRLVDTPSTLPRFVEPCDHRVCKRRVVGIQGLWVCFPVLMELSSVMGF